ncbi:MAG: DNA-3-methyladenine glycosylase family protein [Candidatus Micrarchaeales archaeon]
MSKQKYEMMSDKMTFRKAMLHLKKNDKTLKRIINKLGVIEVNWSPPKPYEAIVESFIYQQIAGSAAEAILKKFKKLYNGRLPTPRQFLKTPEKKVRSAGISPQKYSYIKDLCERITKDELDLESLAELPDEEIIAILDDVRGIGRWTAEMFLMRSLSRVNVFAADDLGLRNAVQRAYKLKNAPDKKKIAELSKNWEPYRSVAALYLWRSID